MKYTGYRYLCVLVWCNWWCLTVPDTCSTSYKQYNPCYSDHEKIMVSKCIWSYLSQFLTVLDEPRAEFKTISRDSNGAPFFFPTFSVSVRLPHNDSLSLKTSTPTSAILTISDQFLWLQGNMAHYFSASVWINKSFPVMPMCVLSFWCQRAWYFFSWIFFTLFPCTLILIGFDRVVHCTSMLILDDHFLSFHFIRKLFAPSPFSTYDIYVFLNVFLPFMLTLFTMTGQPGSSNLRNSNSSSTPVPLVIIFSFLSILEH